MRIDSQHDDRSVRCDRRSFRSDRFIRFRSGFIAVVSRIHLAFHPVKIIGDHDFIMLITAERDGICRQIRGPGALRLADSFKDRGGSADPADTFRSLIDVRIFRILTFYIAKEGERIRKG